MEVNKSEDNPSWRNLFFTYTQDTTLHGLRYTTTARSVRRLVWCAAILTSFGLFTYLLASKLKFLRSNPKTINVEVSYNDSLVFPAVTICNSNKYRMTAIHQEGFYDLLLHGAQLKNSNDSRVSTGQCEDRFNLHLNVCGFPTSPAGNASSLKSGFQVPLFLSLTETSRQVCKTLCTDLYRESCSSIVYFPVNRTCLLTSFTAKNGHKCHGDELVEFYRRIRCPEEAYVNCDHETDSHCSLHNAEYSTEDWTQIEAHKGPITVDNTLNSGRGHYRSLFVANNRPNGIASLHTHYMNTSGKCLSLFYYMAGRDTETSLQIAATDEEMTKRMLYSAKKGFNDRDHWIRAAVKLPSELNIITIEGIRGPEFSSGMAVDDIRIDDCNLITNKPCMEARRGNDYTGTRNVTAMGHSCLPWNEAYFYNTYTVEDLVKSFPDSAFMNGNNLCRTVGESPQPSCYTDSYTIQTCGVNYCECDDEQFECANHFCLPRGKICDGVDDCLDSSDEWQACTHLRSMSCEFSSSYICGYSHLDMNFRWSHTAVNDVVKESHIPDKHPTGHTHYMVVSPGEGLRGESAALISPVADIPANKNLSFYLYLTGTSDTEALQIFATTYGVRRQSIFKTSDFEVPIGVWTQYQVPLPIGEYSLVVMGTLNSAGDSTSIALASMAVIDNQLDNNVEIRDNGSVSCDFVVDFCGYQIISSSKQFTFDRHITLDQNSGIHSLHGCDKEHTAPSGTITSPNYPSNYQNHANCVYYISQPVGSEITLKFTHFTLEHYGSGCYDYIKIASDDIPFSGLPQICGTTLPEEQTLNSSVKILFKTDYSVTKKGFSLTYDSKLPQNLQYHLQTSYSGDESSVTQKATLVSPGVSINETSCLAVRVKPSSAFNLSAYSSSTQAPYVKTDLLRSSIALGTAWSLLRVSVPPLGFAHFTYEVSGVPAKENSMHSMDYIEYSPGVSCEELDNTNGTLECDFSSEDQCGYVDLTEGPFRWLRTEVDTVRENMRNYFRIKDSGDSISGSGSSEVSSGDDDNDDSGDNDSGSGGSGDSSEGNSGSGDSGEVSSGSGDMSSGGSGYDDRDGSGDSGGGEGSGFDSRGFYLLEVVEDYVMGVEVGSSGGSFSLASSEFAIDVTTCLTASLYFLTLSEEEPALSVSIFGFTNDTRVVLDHYVFSEYAQSSHIIFATIPAEIQRITFRLFVGHSLNDITMFVWLGSIQTSACAYSISSNASTEAWTLMEEETVTTTDSMPISNLWTPEIQVTEEIDTEDTCTFELGEPVDQYTHLLNLSGGVDMDDIANNLGHMKQDFIAMCWWDGRQDKCHPIKSEVTDSGLCYTFNNKLKNVLATERTGADYGLRLILNIETYDYAWLSTDFDIGIKVHVHSQEDVASVKDLGFVVSPSVHSLASVTYSKTISLPEPWGNCSAIELLEHDNRTIYTRQRCSLQCKSEAYAEICGCIEPYMPGTTRLCTLGDNLLCAAEKQEIILAKQGECETKCPDACDVITYQTGLSYGDLQGNTIQEILPNEQQVLATKRLQYAVDMRNRVGDDHMKTLLSKIRAVQEQYYTAKNFLYSITVAGATSILHRMREAVDAFENMVENDMNQLLKDLETFDQAYKNSIGPSVILLTSDLRTASGLLSRINSLLYSETSLIQYGAKTQDILISAIDAMEKAKETMDVYRLYRKYVGSPSADVPNQIFSPDEDEKNTCDKEFEHFIDNIGSWIDELNDVTRSFNERELEALQVALNETVNNMVSNIETVATCFPVYNNFLGHFIVWKNSLEFVETNIVTSDYDDVFTTYSQWEEWLVNLLESYTNHSITKEELCQAISGEQMTNAIESFSTATQTVSAVDIAKFKSLISGKQKSLKLYYKEGLQKLGQLGTFFEENKFDDDARGIKLWRQPQPNLNSAQILSYKLNRNEVWRSWSTSVSLQHFFVDTTAGHETSANFIDDYFNELITLLLQVETELTSSKEHISGAVDDLQSYCDTYTNSIEDSNLFQGPNFLKLDIFYGELKYEYIEQLRGYDVLNFLGEVGGYMGLLLGGSVITLIEFIDLVVYNLLQKMTRRRKLNRAVSAPDMVKPPLSNQWVSDLSSTKKGFM